jgi:dTDP-4-dehydrorhamnose reductase
MSSVLVIGESGQLARALARQGTIAGLPVRFAGRSTLGPLGRDGLEALFEAGDIAAVINAAAYTAVDKAESDRAAAEALNADLPAALARLCSSRATPLVHVSTDYVFDGTSTRPCRTDDPIAPLGVYGATKASGEAAIRNAHDRHVIVRTAWVYSEDGHNFAKTMLRLGRERDEVRVVADQRGTPTYAGMLAQAAARITERAVSSPEATPWGTYHVTGAGETTWHGFAAAVFAEAARSRLKVPRLTPIVTADYPTPARRPAYSVLDCSAAVEAFGLSLPPWQESLAEAFPRIAAAA